MKIQMRYIMFDGDDAEMCSKDDADTIGIYIIREEGDPGYQPNEDGIEYPEWVADCYPEWAATRVVLSYPLGTKLADAETRRIFNKGLPDGGNEEKAA
ncbi:MULTISPECIES: hypothetical protein [unclassified Thioalkalivibrio]|uniref:hypothetical protein n=1 Tax=unclassified Thioalkalivibrio TaxID=2621013 RepID=UPI00036A8D87|nr:MULTISPECIES: hypothetical protein [unclassified Thioalkalivibrio]